MVKFFVNFIFEDGSMTLSLSVFDSLSDANSHGEKMLSYPNWNTDTTKVVRYIVGFAEIRF